MAKKIWICVSVITVMLTGFFLFNGGKLLFGYGDRRGGILTLMSGVMTGALYAVSVWEGFRKADSEEHTAEKIWQRTGRELLLSNAAFTLGAAGILLYQVQYQSKMTIVLFLMGMVFFIVLISYAVIFMMKEGGEGREKAFREKLLELKDVCKENGDAKDGDLKEELVARVIESRMNGIKCICAIGIMLVFLLVNPFMEGLSLLWRIRLSVLAVILMAVIPVFINHRMAYRLMNILDEGRPERVTAFFIAYYEGAGRRMARLMPIVKLYAVTALSDMGAYEEALELVRTIHRGYRQDAYYLQFELICLEGMRRKEELLAVLARMKEALMFVKGQQRENLIGIYRIIGHLANARYAEALRILEGSKDVSERQRRQRLKFMEDARNQVFGVPEGNLLEEDEE